MGGNISTEFLQGLATVDDKMLILLAVDELIDFSVIENATTEEPVH